MKSHYQIPLWVVRLTWAALPFVYGPPLADALHSWTRPGRAGLSVALWLGWGLVLLATLVPHPVSLTLIRVTIPAAALMAIVVTIKGHPSFPIAAFTAGSVFSPQLASWFVNGPAYPNERRYPLRAPGFLVAGPAILFWAIVVAAPTAFAVLLADERWLPAVVVGLLGLPVAAVLSRSLHSLSRRWLVFVPAGVVLHDPVSLADPVLFPKKSIEALRLADKDSDSLDLTQRALGLAVELVLTEKIPMGLMVGRGKIEQGASARLLFTPSRPAAVLNEAIERRVPVG